MKSSYCSVHSNYFTSFQAEIVAVLLQQADRCSFKASEVSALVYFYILCNNKNYKKKIRNS